MRTWLFGLAMLTASPASAQQTDVPFDTGNRFVRMCEAKAWKLACVTYVLGVFHGSQSGDVRTVCLPDGVDTMQIYEVSLAYIRSHPKRSHEVALSLILDALTEAFPCR